MSDHTTVIVPAHILVASRETVPTDNMTGYFDGAFTRALQAVRSVGAEPAGPARAYYFSPLTDVVDIAGGFPVAEEHAEALSAAHPDLVHRIPEHEAFVRRHTGSYDGLGAAWQELSDHVRSLGRPTGPVFWEEYVTMPTPEGDPAEMITDLYATFA
ncbi:AraC family transcriptional regulator [Corynebacterium hylobatis]|uniref:AraC family transcriptional regulator n=1 Tax=Corynebacterium hylobatis TaxID=1859290 RepID=A0A3R9ZYK5_9CORY|nr:AraC family transcriptional regulator [Corynebacterium hylobatis]RSZ61711.1 AraC family transcriptional regulator [Corynebacterium hylobatis]